MRRLKRAVRRAAETKRSADTRRRARAQEAVGLSGYTIGSDPDADLPGNENYRPLTQGGRQLPAYRHERSLDIAFYLWTVNPLGKRLVNMGTDHVIGGGIQVGSENEAVDAWLKRFWSDSVNNMALFQYQMADQLSIFGDQCFPVSVNKVNGLVRLGYVDSKDIKEIKVDKANERVVTTVVLKPIASTGDDRPLSVIRVDENPKSGTNGRRVGDCFYFRINAVMNSLRGVPDLNPAADYLDAHDTVVFDRLDLSKLQRAYIWDVSLKGASDAKVLKWRNANRKAPKFGTVRVHNENEEWKILTPDLHAADAKVDADALKLQALIGGGAAAFPLHWFGEGETVNKASAIEMGSPTYKGLLRRQAVIRFMIEEICAFVVDQAVIHHSLTDADATQGFYVHMPEIVTRDLQMAANTAVTAATALQVAEDREYISNQTARQIMANVLSAFGVQVDPARETERIKQEKADADAANADKDRQSFNDILNGMDRDKDDDTPDGTGEDVMNSAKGRAA